MENNDDKNNFEKTISKQNDSGLNLNNINLITHNANIDTNINDIKIDKDKNELLFNSTPKISEKISQRDNLLNSNKNDIFQNLNEEDLIHQINI